jgi:hypothetical protein
VKGANVGSRGEKKEGTNTTTETTENTVQKRVFVIFITRNISDIAQLVQICARNKGEEN